MTETYTDMKKLIYVIIVGLTANLALGQAKFGAYPWTVTLKVVDDNGQPVTNADASVDYYSKGVSTPIAGLTDTNGLFIATHTDWSLTLGIQAKKNGYYPTRIGYQLFAPGQFDAGTVAENRNGTQMLVLRKISNPIAMYAKQAHAKLQQEDKPLGFDLEAGDWVTPNGKGFHTDIFFAVHRKIISDREYDCTMTVTFPNKGDGIAVAPSESVTGSEFKTSRMASENGYQPELDLHYSNTNQPASVFGYFIRVRTELNLDGTVKSALYGKIPGGFRFFAGTKAPRAGMSFDYYLNPTPNNRNLEFDTKNNLVRDLGEFEGVKEP
jgi:hypothetical protein